MWPLTCRYRTEMCKVGLNCTRRICFFAHKPEELRPLPPHLVGTTGGPSAGKYSLSATRQAAAAAAAAAAGARHNAGLRGNIHPAATFPQQPAAYTLAEQSSWGFIPQAASMMSIDGASIAGCLFPGVMQHSHLQQHQPAAAAAMGYGGMGLPPGNPAGWQRQQQQHSGGFSAGTSLTEMSLLSHMQQLRLMGSAPNTPPAHSAPMGSGGMSFLPTAAQWHGINSVAGLTAGSNPDLSGQQYFGGDGLLHGWQQHQHQQQPAPLLQDAGQAFASGPFALPAAQRVLVMQQPQQLTQLLEDHNAALAKAMGSVPAGDVSAGFQQLPVKLVQGSVGGAWQHTQDSWLLPRAPGC